MFVKNMITYVVRNRLHLCRQRIQISLRTFAICVSVCDNDFKVIIASKNTKQQPVIIL